MSLRSWAEQSWAALGAGGHKGEGKDFWRGESILGSHSCQLGGITFMCPTADDKKSEQPSRPLKPSGGAGRNPIALRVNVPHGVTREWGHQQHWPPGNMLSSRAGDTACRRGTPRRYLLHLTGSHYHLLLVMHKGKSLWNEFVGAYHHNSHFEFRNRKILSWRHKVIVDIVVIIFVFTTVKKKSWKPRVQNNEMMRFFL